jgi:protein-disulfide isomerase
VREEGPIVSKDDASGGSRLTAPIGPADHTRGAATAPVTLVEYGDFECPHCGRAYELVNQLEQRYGDRLRFVFRHFPVTNVHPHAQRAAETAEWAASCGAFWEMYDRLFGHQRHLGDDSLIGHARALGLEGNDLRDSWAKHTFIGRVKQDFLSGLASGVQGAPAFFINGVRHQGPWELEDLAAAIDRALAQG